MRPQDQDAVAYVRRHFSENDYGFTPQNLVARDARGETGDEVDAVDVDFVIANSGRPGAPLSGTMCVWFRDDGHLYGEW